MATQPPRRPFQGRIVGDALRGDRVAINARRFSKIEVINLSHEHKAQRIVARDQVYCVIELPLQAKPKGAGSR